ncbi:MAG TPA: CarD family transcriptional regulator [Clostridiaceae bacterium]|jgi:CarD family transcriptional regulator|nr:CarD family transcriptional regulator [Clostridiaceae bacterium]HOA31483.1 CarD family transcriptional regulator [Clostridia bacterium]
MNYSIGDRIVYPMHGAGVITSIETREVMGEMKEYYFLELPYGSTVLMIPVDGLEANGVRDIIDQNEVPNVLEHFRTSCLECNSNWNKRQRENLERLKSGNIFDVIDVYKALYIRELDKNLSTGEKKMLTTARNILFSELMLSTGRTEEEVEELVNNAMGLDD